MALVFAIRNSVQKFRFNCSIHFWIILHRKWIESKVYRFRIFYQEYVLLLVVFLQRSVRHSGLFLKKLIEFFKQLIEFFKQLIVEGLLRNDWKMECCKAELIIIGKYSSWFNRMVLARYRLCLNYSYVFVHSMERKFYSTVIVADPAIFDDLFREILWNQRKKKAWQRNWKIMNVWDTLKLVQKKVANSRQNWTISFTKFKL